MPPVTRALLIINVSVFIAQQFTGDLLYYWFGLWPITSTTDLVAGQPGGFMPWQVITYSFLHGNEWHILFNMLGVWMFGSEVERVMGQARFLNYYLICVLSAAAAQLAVAAISSGPPYPTVGASGGVFGLLLAYGMFFPRRIVMLIIPPIPMPARVFVFVYAAIELFFGVTGTMEGVAHFAHLGGMAGGWLLLRHWRRR